MFIAWLRMSPNFRAGLLLFPWLIFCLWPSVLLLPRKAVMLDAALLIMVWALSSRFRSLLPLVLIPMALALVQLGAYLYSGQLVDVYTVMTFTATNIDETMGFARLLSDEYMGLIAVLLVWACVAIYGVLLAPRLPLPFLMVAIATLIALHVGAFVFRQHALPSVQQVVEQSFYGRVLGIAREFYTAFHDTSHDQAPIKLLEQNGVRLAESVLVVIGESASTYRMSAYGYARETTPFMAKADVLFSDLVSVGLNTQPNVQAMMTGEVGAIRQHHDQDIFRVARQASFNTFYVDNNRFVNRDPMYLIARQSDVYHSLNGIGETIPRNDHKIRHDERVLQPFREVLTSSHGRPRLIFVHLVGSHFNHALRYPRTFNIFPSHYDNSIRYTDHLLQIMHDEFMASSRGESAMMLYVGDHGAKLPPGCGMGPVPVPEVANYANDERYHANMSVPLAFWFSPVFKRLHPRHVNALHANHELPVDQRFLMWTLADSMGVSRINTQSTGTLSLFSSSARYLPRRNSRGEDMDALLARGDICKP